LETEIIELARMAKLIEKHYGSMDIEWATEKSLPYKGEVFILQSRPETVWSQKEVKPVVEPKKSAIEHIVAGLLAGKKIR
jgi:pyruvate,water dikinase